MRSLYSDSLSGLAVDGDQVVVMGQTLVRVPLAGGDPVTLASPEGQFGLLVLGGVAYFEASHAAGDPIGGKQPTEQTLDAVPVAGGDETTVLGADSAPSLDSATTDADSLYFPARGQTVITRFTPPSASIDLKFSAGSSIDAVAVFGDYVYVAAQDLIVGGSANGIIERIPKKGGTAGIVVSNIGHPWNLVADATGLYWQEDPPGFGTGHIAHAQLDGSRLTTLVEANATSLALASGRLYFSTGDTIASIATSGGVATTLESGFKSAGRLTLAGDNLVWVDPASQALSDPTVPTVLTACIPGSG